MYIYMHACMDILWSGWNLITTDRLGEVHKLCEGDLDRLCILCEGSRLCILCEGSRLCLLIFHMPI